MKFKNIILSVLSAIGLIMPSCKEGDGDADYGTEDICIYIPQATLGEGINFNYYVPSGAGKNTYNFAADAANNKLDIILGVIRSGKITDAAGFSVDIVVSTTETDILVAEGEIENAMVLPETMYELPNKVAVEANKNNASFFLTVDAQKLLNGSYDGKNLILVVSIANPTNYKLSEKNILVAVIIDVDAVRSFFEEKED